MLVMDKHYKSQKVVVMKKGRAKLKTSVNLCCKGMETS